MRIETHARRWRRSALQTPAFVDRMDEADDAIGRVAIFSVERAAEPEQRVMPPPGNNERPAPRWIAVVDDPRGAVVLAVCLVLLLVLGLRLTH